MDYLVCIVRLKTIFADFLLADKENILQQNSMKMEVNLEGFTYFQELHVG